MPQQPRHHLPQLLPRFSQYDGFRLEHVPDGLPEDHARSGESIADIFKVIESASKTRLKEALVGVGAAPVTCFVVDGVFPYCYDVAEEVGFLLLRFGPLLLAASGFTSLLLSSLRVRVLPLKDDDDMDELVRVIPGMETSLRRRDLPSFFQIQDASNYDFKNIINVTHQTRRATLILNSFEELEGPFISLIRQHCSPIGYPIGPIHAHLKHKLDAQESSNAITTSTNYGKSIEAASNGLTKSLRNPFSMSALAA
ncbi:hypothetical protein Droror1_Dr00023243 [Drosera rotundifolia]